MTPTVFTLLGIALLLSAASSNAADLVATIANSAAPTEEARRIDRNELDAATNHLRNRQYDQALVAAAKLIATRPRDPTGYNIQAGAYAGKQDFRNARKSLEMALRVQQDYEPALINLAELDLQEKDLASARKGYQAILEKNPQNIVAMLGMAKVESANKNEQESLRWLEQAKAAYPDATAPRLLLAHYYLGTKNYDKARAELTEAQRHYPENAEILELVAQVQTAEGKNADAVSTYKKLVVVQPRSHVAYKRLADAQAAIEDYSAATVNLKKALELKPDYVDALADLTMLEARAHRYADALRLARQIQTLRPGEPAGLALEGDLLVEQQRFSEAVAAYRKALALRQTGSLAIKLHAAQRRTGGANEADTALREWMNAHPEDLAAPLYMAEELGKNGKNQQAIEQYQNVLKRSPDNVVALNNIALIYQREKDPRAVRFAEQAFALAPHSPTTADTLGWILIEQGQTMRGAELLQRAAAMAPKNTEIRYHFAVALAKSGEKLKARKQVEDLLTSTPMFPQREAAETLLKQL